MLHSAPGRRPPKPPALIDINARMSDGLLIAESIVQGTRRGIGEEQTPNDPPPMRPHPYMSGGPPIFVRSPAAKSNSKLRLASKNQHAQNEDAFWSNWRENRSKRPLPIQHAISGAERLAAIKRRPQANS